MSLPSVLAKPLALHYNFTVERLSRATNRAVLEITIEGRPTVMLVPITLINGNLL